MDNWIMITTKKKDSNIISEIRIDKSGRLFIDGQPYDENKSEHKNLSISVEKHSKLNVGEETKKMIQSQKNSQKGDTVVITDVKEPNKIEKTTVRY